MAKITALVHTHNDAARIGRALESLRACDEVLVVDHASTDDTVKLARDHGAVVKEGVPGVSPGVYAMDAGHDWILCLLPSEAVSEGLEASLFEWKERREETSDQVEEYKPGSAACSVAFQVREETGNGWRELGAHTRLVNRKRVNWTGHLPPDDVNAEILPGHLLRFQKP
jgi:glycosyltransferase involved in cell wall biosynthesis